MRTLIPILALALACSPVLAASDVVVERGLVYREIGSRRIALDVYRPAGESAALRPLVICIHGGGWKTGDRRAMSRKAEELARRGFVAASIDYRKSGEAVFPAAVHDTQCAIQWLAANAGRFGASPARIGVFGVSAGGHLALMAAAVKAQPGLASECGGLSPRPVRCAAAWYAPADLVRGMTGGDRVPRASAELADRFIGGSFETHRIQYARASPAAHVSASTPPLFLAHGDQDGVVPYGQSQYMMEAARKHRVDATLLRVRGAGHSFRGNGDPPESEVWERTVAFLTRHLGAPPRP